MIAVFEEELFEHHSETVKGSSINSSGHKRSKSRSPSVSSERSGFRSQRRSKSPSKSRSCKNFNYRKLKSNKHSKFDVKAQIYCFIKRHKYKLKFD